MSDPFDYVSHLLISEHLKGELSEKNLIFLIEILSQISLMVVVGTTKDLFDNESYNYPAAGCTLNTSGSFYVVI